MGREHEMARIDLLSSIRAIRVHSRPDLLQVADPPALAARR
jgi:hypothetical protein